MKNDKVEEAEKIIEALTISVEKRIHPAWIEWKKIGKKYELDKDLVGKWQYIYTSDKGEVSLIQIVTDLTHKNMKWEIYYKNIVRRFKTKAEAEIKIRSMLS